MDEHAFDMTILDKEGNVEIRYQLIVKQLHLFPHIINPSYWKSITSQKKTEKFGVLAKIVPKCHQYIFTYWLSEVQSPHCGENGSRKQLAPPPQGGPHAAVPVW